MAVKKMKKKQVKEEKSILTPTMYVDHDAKNYYIQVELPGVRKEDVDLSVSDQSFCVKGPREDAEYVGCYALAHLVEVEKARAKFDNGLLSIQIPIKKVLEGKKITIE